MVGRISTDPAVPITGASLFRRPSNKDAKGTDLDSKYCRLLQISSVNFIFNGKPPNKIRIRQNDTDPGIRDTAKRNESINTYIPVPDSKIKINGSPDRNVLVFVKVDAGRGNVIEELVLGPGPGLHLLQVAFITAATAATLVMMAAPTTTPGPTLVLPATPTPETLSSTRP